ncbi:Predicted transposase YbfD/YdcC associated with H repeats [Modicisalibacter ilicicola DSM 19980]|uniref:Predicted transposase YbfD/YdcC associated with H repeats n=1 Tax=Modicisalibacter ilicicola DSM 19980 TaxID=1121942 RepID=A0A1M5D1U0_9GAMM|nr:Predicted transposase YbfD/YdcC associated with H repeats [Halomonas ilicicola DSM 19980]
MEAVAHVTRGEVVAIDGKTLRRSHDRAEGKSATHMISAWASKNVVVLGQLKTEDKSNEITAIPALLDLLALDGGIVTIGAMGCQKAIAGTIIDQDADDVLALNGNQRQLYDDVTLFFDTGAASGFGDIAVNHHQTVDADYGQIETRRTWATTALDGIVDPGQWSGLNSIGMVEAEREIDDQTTVERRYYIASLEGNAEPLGAAIRAHWGIENRLHWSLDVAFREDDCRVRKDHGPDNMAMLRHLTLNLLRQETTCKRGIKTKRLKAGWNEQYLFKVLTMAS